MNKYFSLLQNKKIYNNLTKQIFDFTSNVVKDVDIEDKFNCYKSVDNYLFFYNQNELKVFNIQNLEVVKTLSTTFQIHDIMQFFGFWIILDYEQENFQILNEDFVNVDCSGILTFDVHSYNVLINLIERRFIIKNEFYNKNVLYDYLQCSYFNKTEPNIVYKKSGITYITDMRNVIDFKIPLFKYFKIKVFSEHVTFFDYSKWYIFKKDNCEFIETFKAHDLDVDNKIAINGELNSEYQNIVELSEEPIFMFKNSEYYIYFWNKFNYFLKGTLSQNSFKFFQFSKLRERIRTISCDKDMSHFYITTRNKTYIYDMYNKRTLLEKPIHQGTCSCNESGRGFIFLENNKVYVYYNYDDSLQEFDLPYTITSCKIRNGILYGLTKNGQLLILNKKNLEVEHIFDFEVTVNSFDVNENYIAILHRTGDLRILNNNTKLEHVLRYPVLSMNIEQIDIKLKENLLFLINIPGVCIDIETSLFVDDNTHFYLGDHEC